MAPDGHASLKAGDYAPPKSSDRRSPCPAINALANHGYIPRDGRNVRANEIYHGLRHQIGISPSLSAIFAYPIFLEQQPADYKAKMSWWSMLTQPIVYMFGGFGMREPGQKDSNGVDVLNLDQLGLHNKVEHDVSLSRLDTAQGDNTSPNPKLIEQLLDASTDGKIITSSDFIELRRKRYAQQQKDNPELDFKDPQIKVACSEIALILKVFGNGEDVPVDYVRAFFQDGRLPRDEGWLKRNWGLGVLEMGNLTKKIKARDILAPPAEAEPTN